MAPAASTVFSAEKMIGLLQEIDNNVRLIVHYTQNENAEVRQEVGVLLQTYLGLLSKVLSGCKHLRNFAEISKRSMEAIEKTLNLVLTGSVSEVLEDIRMEHYLPNFERKDIRSAYQLIKPSFDIEQVDVHTDAAKEAIHDKVQDLRKDFSTIKGRLQEVKENGVECYRCSTEITKNFDTLVKEIKETKDKLGSLLGWHRFKKTAVCVSACLAILVAIGVIGICVVLPLASAGCACFAAIAVALAPVPSDIVILFSVAGGLGSAALVGTAGYNIYQQKKEMNKISEAVERLQQQLNKMSLDASDQMVYWEAIDTLAEIVKKQIDDTTEQADNLEPNHHSNMKRLLQEVQSVHEKVEDLEDEVETFQKEAELIRNKLRDLSLMKESETVPAPSKKPTSLSQLIEDFRAYLKNRCLE